MHSQQGCIADINHKKAACNLLNSRSQPAMPKADIKGENRPAPDVRLGRSIQLVGDPEQRPIPTRDLNHRRLCAYDQRVRENVARTTA
jgi:hypothetical protein